MIRLREKIQQSYRVKKILHRLLRSPLVTFNPLYTYAYRQRVKKMIPALTMKPSFVQLENTNRCNLSCVFCPHDAMRRQQGTMSTEIYELAIAQCLKYKIPNVILTGFGEPLLDSEYVARVQYAKDRGIPVVSCVTNGTLLTEDIADKLLTAGLDYLSVSIDAATKQTYDAIHHHAGKGQSDSRFFKLVENNIDALIRLKQKRKSCTPVFEVRFKDFETNRPDLGRFISKYRNRVDALSIFMNIFNWPGSGISHNLPRNHALRFPCFNLWSTVYVTYDGRFVLCCQDYEASQELGDIRRDDIMSVWNSNKLEHIRNKHLRGAFSALPLCGDCVINTHYVSPWW